MKKVLDLRVRAILFGALVFCIVVGMSVFHIAADRASAIANAGMHLLHTAQNIAAKQQTVIFSADLQIHEFIAQRRERRVLSNEQCARTMARLVKMSVGATNMGIADLNGDVKCTSQPLKSAINVADRRYFQLALETNQLVVSDVVVSRITGKPTVVVARALPDEAQGERGVVFVSLDFAELDKDLARVDLPRGSRLGLFDARGIGLSHQMEPGDWAVKEAFDSTLIKAVKAQGGEGRSEITGLDGARHIVSFTPFSDTIGGQIFLWVSVPKAAVTAAAQRDFVWTLGLAAGFFLLILWGIWVGGERLLLRPISALSNAAHRLAKGELDARTGLPHDASDLGRLARSFDGMAQSIKAKETQLTRTNRALRVLSAGNRTMLHASDEPTLLREMCQAIANSSGYHMAWVGYAQNDAQRSVQLVASAGMPVDFQEALQISWADTERGCGPVGVAIRDAVAVTVRDMQSDPSVAQWRALALRYNYDSVLSMPLTVNNAVIGALTIYAVEPDAFGAEELTLLTESAADLAYGIENIRMRQQHEQAAIEHKRNAETLLKALEDGVQAIAATVEMRDPYTAGHQRRVAVLAVAIAREMALPQATIHGLHLAAVVHDLGKIQVPAEILSKPGTLGNFEFELIKTHAQTGYEILKGIDFPWPVANIVRQHHERVDGSGYPQGLRGEQILLEARILAVADVIEAMASHRPYRASKGQQAALQEIESGSGSLYDPTVVAACLKLFRSEQLVLGS